MADVRPSDKMTETRAEIRLPTQDLRDDLAFFTKVLKMRLDMIYPADNPQIAVLSGHGLRLRIEKGAREAPGTLRITSVKSPFGAPSFIVSAQAPLMIAASMALASA